MTNFPLSRKGFVDVLHKNEYYAKIVYIGAVIHTVFWYLYTLAKSFTASSNLRPDLHKKGVAEATPYIGFITKLYSVASLTL